MFDNFGRRISNWSSWFCVYEMYDLAIERRQNLVASLHIGHLSLREHVERVSCKKLDQLNQFARRQF